MRSKVGLMYALGMLSLTMTESRMFGGAGTNDGSLGHGIPDNPKRVIPNGCKLFKIYGVEIIAISEKSARKKYRKMQLRKGGNHENPA